MPKISIFRNFNEVVENKPLEKILEDIKADTFKNQIIHLRKCLEANKMISYEREKKALPAFTPSGHFERGRKMEFLKQYVPYLILDFDKIPDGKITEIRTKITNGPFTYTCFTSPSGNGLKAIIQTDATKETHADYFLKAQKYYEDLTGHPVDKSGKDITRLCFFSYDPDIYINSDSKVFSLIENNNPDKSSRTVGGAAGGQFSPSGGNAKGASVPPLGRDLGRDSVSSSGGDLEEALRFTENKIQFVEGNRNNFIHQLACNCNRNAIPEMETLGFILARFNYDEKEIRTTVAGVYKNTAEHGKLTMDGVGKVGKITSPNLSKNKEADKLEVIITTGADESNQSSQKKVPYIDRIEDFLLERYEFRNNIVTGKLEFRRNKEHHFSMMNDFLENSILRELMKGGMKCNITILRAILNSNFSNLYNPFEAYFSSLSKWDEKTDYILQLADTITTTRQEHWHYCFKKWLVALVACVLDDKTINHTVIVFSGKQGIGKTTWMENLIPAYLKNHLFSGTINPNNKDTLIHLSECMLINLDELENLNRTEIGSLKELITKSHIRVRKAYGHNSESLPRRASFVGSVNTAQFLNDTTGSRRFLCFEVTDIHYQHHIAIDNVYSQAFHLYKTGFRFWFDKSEIESITDNNEQYQIRSVEEELLLTWFEPVILPLSGGVRGGEEVVGSSERWTSSPSGGGQVGASLHPGGGALFLNSTQLASRLAEKAKITITDGTVIKLGKALKKHGFQRIKKAGAYVYAVRELTWEEVSAQNERKEVETNEVKTNLFNPESRITSLPNELDFPEDDLPF